MNGAKIRELNLKLSQKKNQVSIMVDSFGFNAAGEAEDNRVREYLSDLNNRTNDQEEMMMEIMEALNDTVTPIPEVGGFYTLSLIHI